MHVIFLFYVNGPLTKCSNILRLPRIFIRHIRDLWAAEACDEAVVPSPVRAGGGRKKATVPPAREVKPGTQGREIVTKRGKPKHCGSIVVGSFNQYVL